MTGNPRHQSHGDTASTPLNDAIDEALRDIGAIETRMGITAQSLRAIKERLLELAKSPAFIALTTPAADRTGIYYILGEPAHLPYGLYLNVAPAGNRAPPHCHGVWCVAAGFRGEEVNKFYRPAAAGHAGTGKLRAAEESVLRAGVGLYMLPDDIHSVAVSNAGPAAHLHLYARRLSRFPDLVVYDPAAGTCRTAPAPVPRRLDNSTVN